jgi:hypothetical protein
MGDDHSYGAFRHRVGLLFEKKEVSSLKANPQDRFKNRLRPNALPFFMHISI